MAGRSINENVIYYASNNNHAYLLLCCLLTIAPLTTCSPQTLMLTSYFHQVSFIFLTTNSSVKTKIKNPNFSKKKSLFLLTIFNFFLTFLDFPENEKNEINICANINAFHPKSSSTKKTNIF